MYLLTRTIYVCDDEDWLMRHQNLFCSLGGIAADFLPLEALFLLQKYKIALNLYFLSHGKSNKKSKPHKF